MAPSKMASAVSENVETWKAKLDKFLHQKNAVNDLFEKLEQKTGVRRLYLASGVFVFIALYLVVGYGAQFVCNFIGFLYPAYASIKAIESREKDDDTKWLTYWVVYSVFSLVEFFADILLFWIPFYWLLKCLFLVWCMAPITNNGATLMYYRFIRPFILRYETKIDKAIDEAKNTISEVQNAAEGMAQDEAYRRVIDSAKLE
ncbi:receptor expression-enhancing protein 5-like isoform X2 [Gigantopelta aegis]|uniref:receptor expression-enhancing protein 5-like isoform X2 n=1 Tax=Gigantopelta aegis TaxID=1735272 RepID=UPI001B88E64D|nr:receptor expression-enhancing protein 5-like isoform X2 [Gigantopelta aegis]